MAIVNFIGFEGRSVLQLGTAFGDVSFPTDLPKSGAASLEVWCDEEESGGAWWQNIPREDWNPRYDAGGTLDAWTVSLWVMVTEASYDDDTRIFELTDQAGESGTTWLNLQLLTDGSVILNGPSGQIGTEIFAGDYDWHWVQIAGVLDVPNNRTLVSFRADTYDLATDVPVAGLYPLGKLFFGRRSDPTTQVRVRFDGAIIQNEYAAWLDRLAWSVVGVPANKTWINEWAVMPSGDAHLALDEVPNDGDTTFLMNLNDTMTFRVGYDYIVPPERGVWAVKPMHAVSASGSGTPYVRCVFKVGSTLVLPASWKNYRVLGVYDHYYQVFANNPATSAPWTQAAITQIESGVHETERDDLTVRCTLSMLEVLLGPEHPASGGGARRTLLGVGL